MPSAVLSSQQFGRYFGRWFPVAPDSLRPPPPSLPPAFTLRSTQACLEVRRATRSRAPGGPGHPPGELVAGPLALGGVGVVGGAMAEDPAVHDAAPRSRRARSRAGRRARRARAGSPPPARRASRRSARRCGRSTRRSRRPGVPGWRGPSRAGSRRSPSRPICSSRMSAWMRVVPQRVELGDERRRVLDAARAPRRRRRRRRPRRTPPRRPRTAWAAGRGRRARASAIDG